MIIYQYLTQPARRSRYVSLFQSAFEHARFTHFDAAVAYSTNAGVDALVDALRLAPHWSDLAKRWLVGIDWCRSEPIALERLSFLPHSAVRVFDGEVVVARRQCVPVLPFHPKTFILHSDGAVGVICGSGNLSRNGLTLGHEVGSLVAAIRPLGNHEQAIWNSCEAVITWFEQVWRGATPLNRVLAAYRRQYERVPHLKAPTPTDEDVAPRSAGGRRGLSPDQLRQLRACRYFWIEAGNLHENRGPGQPGNQLMLSRMMRVFFGFPARDLPQDTYIGEVSIEYGGHRRDDCSLRFSNNSMDVLTLPLPGAEGPTKYDQETLLFEKVSDGRGFRFVLRLAAGGDKRQWRTRSQRVDGAYQMTSGREWGLF
jgi:hypothetical protein